MRAELDAKMERTEMRMIRCVCVFRKKGRPALNRESVKRRCSLRWHGHVDGKDDGDCAKACAMLTW